MSFFIKKINVLLFILVALAIMELFIGFEASKETWEMIVTIAVQILQFLLFILLMALLRKVIRQSVDKEKQYQRLLDHSQKLFTFIEKESSSIRTKQELNCLALRNLLN